MPSHHRNLSESDSFGCDPKFWGGGNGRMISDMGRSFSSVIVLTEYQYGTRKFVLRKRIN